MGTSQGGLLMASAHVSPVSITQLAHLPHLVSDDFWLFPKFNFILRSKT